MVRIYSKSRITRDETANSAKRLQVGFDKQPFGKQDHHPQKRWSSFTESEHTTMPSMHIIPQESRPNSQLFRRNRRLRRRHAEWVRGSHSIYSESRQPLSEVLGTHKPEQFEEGCGGQEGAAEIGAGLYRILGQTRVEHWEEGCDWVSWYRTRQ